MDTFSLPPLRQPAPACDTDAMPIDAEIYGVFSEGAGQARKSHGTRRELMDAIKLKNEVAEKAEGYVWLQRMSDGARLSPEGQWIRI